VSSNNAVPSAEQTETVGKEVEMNVTIQMIFTTEYTYEQLSSKTEPVMMGNKPVPRVLVSRHSNSCLHDSTADLDA